MEVFEDEIRELRQTRGKLKGHLTRFQTFLSSPNNINIIELEIRLNKIESVFEKFDEIQSRLEILDENEIEQREERETDFYQTISKAKGILVKYHESQRVVDTQVNAQNANNSIAANTNSLANLKLPTISLPMFSGNYDEWTTFHDTFSQLIHNDTSLTNIQKFYYLKSCLKHDASRLIHSLEISENNYTVAWESLVKRYENKRIIVNTHVRAIFDLPVVTKDSAISLRQLTDKVQHHLGALKNLKLPTDNWDVLLIYLITSKLDHITNREWENSLENDTLPTYEHLNSFLNKKCFTLETLSDNNRKVAYNVQKYSNDQNHKPYSHSTSFKQKFQEQSFAVTDFGKEVSCHYCKASHFIYNCADFIKLSTDQKYNEIKRLRLCSNCLRPGHMKWVCKSSRCKRCNLSHNTLLHDNNFQSRNSNDLINRQANNESQKIENVSNTSNLVTKSETISSELTALHVTNPKAQVHIQSHSLPQSFSENLVNVSDSKILQSTSFSNIHDSQLVLLSTAQILIYDSHGDTHVCRALLDSGSQSNLITHELCKTLNLPCDCARIPIAGINQKAITITHKTNATIKSRSNSHKYNLTFLVLSTITEKIPFTEFNRNTFKFPTGITLADPEFNKPQKIDILLGANIFYELLCANQLRLGKNMPNLQETTLGWIVTGSVNLHKFSNQNVICNFTHNISNEMLDESLTKFWKTEEIPHKTIFTKEEQFCEDYFEKTTTRTSDGTFLVRLPISNQISNLGDSATSALKRFHFLENRFKRDENLKTDYTEFMKQYESMGHMTFIKNFDGTLEQPSYVLPHHAVFKNSSTTTRCRVVFDGSAKTNEGISLNDLLLVGPNIQDDLFAIVARLRLHRYVLSADVKMMFRQVMVHPEDRKYQQIIWRYNQSEPIKLYSLNTVTYGTASASYLATKILQKLSFEFEEKYPRTCKIIRHSFYMDDLLTSVDTIEEALEVFNEITQILNSANFPLRKWCSNEKIILDSILGDNENNDKLIEIHDSKELKTLGISWDPRTDTLSYSVNINCENQVMTKRSVLAAISKIFDPLGLIGPATIQAKLFMRQLWQRNISWDENLPSDMINQWKTFLQQIHSINDININRHVLCENPITIELHGFSDSSEKAYGSCIYIFSKNVQGETISRLLCAKSKVVPQGKHNLPRLELLAATLLAELMHIIKQTLDVKISCTKYYCDSTIVLAWLKIDPGRLKTFVANRITKITELTAINDWKHVRSEDNPADIISRGINPNELESLRIWWHGPAFLLESRDSYQHKVDDIDVMENIPEMKQSTFTLTATNTNFNLYLFERYSTLTKLQRVVAYCIRFKTIGLHKNKLSHTLTVEELDYSLKLLIKISQKIEFSQEIGLLNLSRPVPVNSRLISLIPFLDLHGLIRVGGRLKHSHVSYSQKHPIILPKSHKLTKLIIEYEHSKHLHAGVQNLLSLIRLNYWPIDGKNLVKRVVKSCMKCFRVNPESSKFLMGELPSSRVIPSRPFSKCGVDYAGPILVKEGTLRRAKLVKTYICIFVCFSTRTVHIELVKDLSTDSFLNALKRFISRRGKPSDILSDNGSNFIGANNHFLELSNLLKNKSHKERIKTFLASDGIKWSFIPAKSPHMGGIWEAAVKSTKFHLRRILGLASLTYEELYTVLTQIESCLNSRPLSPLSSDPNDNLPLTPAHFLIGDTLTTVPQRDVQDCNIHRLSRYQRMQQLFQHFWTRWSRDYLTQLQQRSKWKTTSANPKVGDLVILKEENVPPLRWPMARIVEIHPGTDKVIRVVSVRVSNGNIFKRSVSKICFLPMEHQV